MKYQIKVTPALSRVVQEYLMNQGMKRYGYIKDEDKCVYVKMDGKEFTTYLVMQDVTKIISFEELVEVIEPTKPKIMIGEHEVKRVKAGIKIGCQEITFGEIRKINAWLKESSNIL